MNNDAVVVRPTNSRHKLASSVYNPDALECASVIAAGASFDSKTGGRDLVFTCWSTLSRRRIGHRFTLI
jgi:hypothetical protein